ncbi:MAG: CHAD domain-containing protein [Betaproteobacteria bacterium]|nr:CHAD domain-containing protein [Betaproteobacteria bacterium]
MVTQETELKLAATPRTLARLATDPLLGAPSGAPQRLVAVYFDTPRFALWRRGISLRLRRERGRWVQGVKGGGTVDAGLQRRTEIEHPAAGPVPDLALVRDHPLGKLLVRAAGTKPLVPAFQVEVVRAMRTVSPVPGVTIEVSLDRGTIGAGRKRAPIGEIELELKSGEAWRLHEFALALARRYSLRVEERSKAERGYELAGGVQAAPVRARLGVIRREMSSNEAFKAIGWTYLNHLQANYRGASRGADPEYVHQARVALRRLRSGMSAFAKLFPAGMVEPQAKLVREMAGALGPAREWDVFAEQTLAPVMEQFPGHRGLAALERACARLRVAANRDAQRALASRRYQLLVLGVAAWLGEERWLAASSVKARRAWELPVRDHAVAVLVRYHRRLLKRGRGLRRLSLRRLHRLRIAAKKLRYAAGFFAPLFSRERSKPMLDALNDLQDVLGAISDCAAAPALIDAATAAARGPLRQQARVIVSHWTAAMLEDRRRELKHVWRTIHGCDRFWR